MRPLDTHAPDAATPHLVEPSAPEVLQTVTRRPARSRSLFRILVSRRQGQIGLALAAMIFVIVVAGHWLAPYSPSQIGTGASFEGSSSAHWLGTDNLGRDVWSRFLYGGVTVIGIPLLSVVLATAVGAALGMLAGYERGIGDLLISRIFDVLLTLPSLLLGLILISSLGTSPAVLVFVTFLLFMPRMGRNVRAATLDVRSTDFIASAQARGEPTLTILFREIAPNVVTPVIANFVSYLSYAVVFVSSLSFLGLGDQPPSSSWGLMVAQSRIFLQIAPAATMVPAAGIATMSVAMFLIGDVLMGHLTRETTRGVGLL